MQLDINRYYKGKRTDVVEKNCVFIVAVQNTSYQSVQLSQGLSRVHIHRMSRCVRRPRRRPTDRYSTRRSASGGRPSDQRSPAPTDDWKINGRSVHRSDGLAGLPGRPPFNRRSERGDRWSDGCPP
jgi:hypothetical protein